MEDWLHPILAIIVGHPAWAAIVLFATAFTESFAFLSLLFPGTSLLIAAGALVANGTLPRGPVIVGAVAGAVLGDTVSYWIGRHYGAGIARLWPFSRDPGLLPKGIRFFERHGGKSVFIGRFFGPLRAVIPLAAGLMRMPRGRFWLANIASAAVWAPMLLLVGDAVGRIGDTVFGSENAAALIFGLLVVVGIVGIVVALWRARRPKA